MSFFDYFQIATVAIFVLVILVKALYLRLKRNINPIAIGRGKHGLAWAFELLGFAGLVVWMVEILLYAFHAGFHIFPPPLDVQLIDSQLAKIVGVNLITFGLIIFMMAYVSFGDSWRVGVDLECPGSLVTKGIFALSRNPIYVFINLWFFGIFLINGTLIFLIFAVLAAALQHWQITQEEAFLTKLYGQPYRDYCSRTGRYVRF
jgi:protein-S-isoprenylcysteine O-methyltransferase Ste14